MQDIVITPTFSIGEQTDLTADILKATPPKHPILQRLSAKLNDELHTGNMISRYDRMHHRHARS